jgi:hypothetical protein
MSALRAWLFGLVRDPVSGDPSSSRVSALLLVVAGIVVALTGRPSAERAAVITALVGGGAASILSRTRAGSLPDPAAGLGAALPGTMPGVVPALAGLAVAAPLAEEEGHAYGD